MLAKEQQQQCPFICRNEFRCTLPASWIGEGTATLNNAVLRSHISHRQYCNADLQLAIGVARFWQRHFIKLSARSIFDRSLCLIIAFLAASLCFGQAANNNGHRGGKMKNWPAKCHTYVPRVVIIVCLSVERIPRASEPQRRRTSQVIYVEKQLQRHILVAYREMRHTNQSQPIPQSPQKW